MKIDCSITENYLKECVRAYAIDGHPIAPLSAKATVEDIKKLVIEVQRWSDAHTQKTYLEDLLEKYPNTVISENNTPDGICPDQLGYERESSCKSVRCVDCWNQIMEENNA